ncbi:MAG: hypothetical protein AAB466_06515 [Verrucomicrobiota bacterium]
MNSWLRFRLGLTIVLLSVVSSTAQVLDLSNRRELLVDHYLIERLQGAQLKLHEPQKAGIVLKFDLPWEGPFVGYATVIKDGETYRLYYRGLPTAGKDGSEMEVTCYAQSEDGINWHKPVVGLFDVRGQLNNNVVLHGQAPASHNFSPFLDQRPGVPASERFKAVGGTQASELLAFVSGDGIHWSKWQDKPVFTKGIFDSQNVVFWSESESCYACYFRTWTGEGYAGFRTVSRATSPDLLRWTDPVAMDFGATPNEHLYTSQTHPCFRAPHIYIATPMRLMPGRKVLTEAQAKTLGVHANYQGDCADAVFMTSRGSNRFDRTFMEAWIRPGADLGNWASRAGMTALGVVPTGPAEMSIYKQANYAQPSACLVRYTLRTDGFVSINAPYRGGEMVTKPFRFSGKELVINFATSAAGSLRVELQIESGQAVPGFSLEEAVEAVGDEIERVVSWKPGSDVSKLAGQVVRLRFVMKDADLYSLRFR